MAAFQPFMQALFQLTQSLFELVNICITAVALPLPHVALKRAWTFIVTLTMRSGVPEHLRRGP